MTNFFIGRDARAEGLEPEVSHEELRKAFSIESEKLVSELVEKTQKYERLLNPRKKYFLSEKVKLVKPSISRANSERIVQFVTELAEQGEHVAVDGFYSGSTKFFRLREKAPGKDPSERQKRRKLGEEREKAFRGKEKHHRKIRDESSESKAEIDEERDSKEKESGEDAGQSAVSRESGAERKNSGLDRQFMDTINKSSTELSVWKDHCLETRVDFAGQARSQNRSFFGFYNFHSFFNHFVILYERLKFMKFLTEAHGVFEFMKVVMTLNFAGVLESEFYEDVVGCLLFEHSGVFLNLERILSNVVKEIPSHEIDRFVIDVNADLFRPQAPADSAHQGYPSGANKEEWLFVQTCFKLGSLNFKNKTGCKQSPIQSYAHNSHLANDHLLKFEFRSGEQVFVIHKVRSVFAQAHKKVA